MKNFFINVWLDAWNFIKNPKDQKDPNQQLGFKFKQLFSILVIDIIAIAVIAFIIVYVEEMGFVSTESHKMNDLFDTKSKWLILFLGVIFVPFLEEIIFRLYLRKRYNPIRLISFISGIVKPLSKEYAEAVVDRNWHKYYRIFFYVATLIFAVIHITNYELTVTVLVFIPLLTAPQFITGLFIGYLRVRFGLIWGILLHFLHNLIFLGTSLLYLSQPVQSFYVENQNYKLKIEESGFNNSNSKMNSFSGDTIIYENVKFKTMMAQLLETEEVLIDIQPETIRLENISFNFIALTADQDAKLIILNEIQTEFDFKLLKNMETQESWALKIADKNKLYQHLSDSLDTNSIITKVNNIKLEKVKLLHLAKTLNSNFDEYIVSDLNLGDQFKFNLQKKDFETLEQELNTKYGLQLEKTSREVEKITIQFKE
jgi:membrane protease YdiL (CAAX protease family)